MKRFASGTSQSRSTRTFKPQFWLPSNNFCSRIRTWISGLLRFEPQTILAIPICIVIIALFIVEGTIYFLVRLLGRFAEKLSTSSSIRRLIAELKASEDFESYAACAERLDELTGRNQWKLLNTPCPQNYDPTLITRKIEELNKAREEKDYVALFMCVKGILETQLQNTLHPSLYSLTFSGTKHLAEKLQSETVESIKFLTQAVKTQGQIMAPELLAGLYHLTKTFGATGLVLSGGAMLGLHHCGLLECLILKGLLPRIISGTSAGSAMAAFVCTRTEDEVLEILADSERMKIFTAPFDPNNWIKRLVNIIKYGYTINVTGWFERGHDIFGTITFLEAFHKTGRVLNITASRAGSVGDWIVLNYRNAPNVLIATAVLASSAFPYLGCPVLLMEKDPTTGEIRESIEYSQRYFHDGSLRGDVPCDILRLDWGVKYVVVSQVNPHVFPFLDLRSHGSPGVPIRGWGATSVWRGGFPLAVVEVALKEHLRFLLRVLALLEVLPSINGINITHVALQSYGGDLNICPSRLYSPHIFLMNNVPPRLVKWFIQVGRQMVFPKVWLIRARIEVEQALQSLTTQARALRKTAAIST